MPGPAQVPLEAGRVYRTGDFRAWGANPTRLASRLVREGRLRKLGHGLFHAPRSSWFGEVPPTDEALLDRFFNGSPWIYSGPQRWNALGLGSTGVYVWPLVYNRKRSGLLEIGRRRFLLKRRAFPRDPPPEYFVVDLLRHAEEAGVGREVVEEHLRRRLALGSFDTDRLLEMARRYGTAAEEASILAAVQAA